jgi:tRNA nucleotidyltransferase (CCA-adding enzyme)
VSTPEESRPAPGTPSLRREGLPRAVVELCERLSAAGYRAWVVGGSVRDSLLAQRRGTTTSAGWHAKDWDLATDARPEQITPLFRRVIPTGIEHGTVTVLLHGLQLEVTTLRADRSYSDGRHPEQIEYVTSIDEDLARRDFTVNAIAFEPQTEQLIDTFGGLVDLEARRLRAVGEASRRFAEDGLRVLRAARLVATLEFELDPDTAAAIRPSLDTYRRVSAERVRDEWQKALSARAPSRAFSVMQEHGLLEITAPELSALAGKAVEAGGDALSLALARMDRCAREPVLRLAALARDVHPEPAQAAELADALLARLRYSNAERKSCTHLVRHPLPARARLESAAEVRRWLQRIGPDQHPLACQLERADLGARNAPPEAMAALDAFERRAAEELAQQPPLSLSALAVEGKLLMAEAGYRPGREIGKALEALLDRVLDDPAQNTREHLLEIARTLPGGQKPP